PKDLDANSLRRLKFLRCFVRVNNLPRQCCQEELVGLFVGFGPLRSWHVAFDDDGGFGACSGFGYVVFRHRAHAEEAIDVLNCCVFGGRKLRVDWTYPCA
uniref:RRM domain-containing protein n=1 Tax=Triticum urartu TaxID=4572 RepID=A0A8R7TEV3_TRIUA